MATARQQKSLSMELRSALSLYRVLERLGRTQEGMDELRDIYGRFTEGFETADLNEVAHSWAPAILPPCDYALRAVSGLRRARRFECPQQLASHRHDRRGKCFHRDRRNGWAGARKPLGIPVDRFRLGTRQYASGGCMAHEASHRNLSSERWLNEALGIAVCWPFFVTLGGYRRFHNRLHHRISLADEENSIYEDYEDWGLPSEEVPLEPVGRLLASRRQAADWGDRSPSSHKNDRGFLLGSRSRGKHDDAYSLGSFVAAAAYFALLDELLLYWIVPWLIVVPVLNYWSEVGDHYRVTGALTRSNLNWSLNTFVAHNIGYHALHHRHPSIPWFRLAEAYPIFRSELEEQVSSGYLSTFRQIMAAKPVVGTCDLRDRASSVEPTPACRSADVTFLERLPVETPAFVYDEARIAQDCTRVARMAHEAVAGCSFR